jgi:hypothetical protein
MGCGLNVKNIIVSSRLDAAPKAQMSLKQSVSKDAQQRRDFVVKCCGKNKCSKTKRVQFVIFSRT